MALTSCMTFTSCSDDDNIENGGGASAIDPKEVSFIVTSGDPTTDLTGGVYMKIYNDLSTAKNGENVYGTANAVKCYDSFTQVNQRHFYGLYLCPWRFY